MLASSQVVAGEPSASQLGIAQDDLERLLRERGEHGVDLEDPRGTTDLIHAKNRLCRKARTGFLPLLTGCEPSSIQNWEKLPCFALSTVQNPCLGLARFG